MDLANENSMESGKSIQKPTPFDKDNLRQLVVFLRSTFPGLNNVKIQALCNMSKKRISKLLDSKATRYGNQKEFQALWDLHDDLKSGKKSYVPAKHVPELPERYNTENLKQFCDFLKSLLIARYGSRWCRRGAADLGVSARSLGRFINKEGGVLRDSQVMQYCRIYHLLMSEQLKDKYELGLQ